MYGPDVAILLTYGSHDVGHVDFRGLTVVNWTPRFWGITRQLAGLESSAYYGGALSPKTDPGAHGNYARAW